MEFWTNIFKVSEKKAIVNKSNKVHEMPTMTAGISQVTCHHGICKGFTAMESGESPQIFTSVMLRRLPKRVRAKRRVFLYDNSCNCHKVALRRYPYRIRRWIFLIDRHHQKNHSKCSRAYNMKYYDQLKHVNSQLAEQLNRKLRKMAPSLAHYRFETYMKVLEHFFAYNNLKTKNIITC